MSRFLYRLGRGSAAHPWRTLLAWLVAALAVLGPGRLVRRRAAGRLRRPRRPCPGGRGPAPRALPRAPATPTPGSSSTTTTVAHPRPPRSRRSASGSRTCRTSSRSARPGSPRTATPLLIDVGYDVPVTDPDLMGNLDPLEDAVEADPRLRAAGRARWRGARQRRRADRGVRRDDRHRRRAADPGAGLRLRRRRRAARSGSRSPVWASARGGVILLAAVMDVSTVRPDGRHDGRPRRRHRLRPADRRSGTSSTSAAGTSSPRPPGGRSRPPAGRWSSPPATVLVSLMGLRLAGLPGLLLLRVRHRDRRRLRAWPPR